MAKNVVIWADIPVTDMERARRFYGALLQAEIPLMPGTNDTVALLPGGSEEGVVSADLAMGENMKPSMDGPTVYLDPMGDIDAFMQRVASAGGRILQAPMDMGPVVGVIGFFVDSEGNRMGVRGPGKQG
jgi:uncharacterized protein